MSSITDKYRKPMNNKTTVLVNERDFLEKKKKLKDLIKDLETRDMMVGLSNSEKTDLENAKNELEQLNQN